MSYNTEMRARQIADFISYLGQRLSSLGVDQEIAKPVTFSLLLLDLNRTGAFAGMPTLDYGAVLQGVNRETALDRVATIFMQPNTGWNVQPKTYPILGRPNAVAMHCSARYSWGPPEANFDGVLVPLLNLRCEAEFDQTQRVALKLCFEDQFGWFANEAHTAVTQTLEFVGRGLFQYGALAERFTLRSDRFPPYQAIRYVIAIQKTHDAKRLLEKEGNLAGAFECAQQAVQLAPLLGRTWASRGMLNYARRDFSAVITDLTQAIDRGMNEADIFSVRGRAYHDLGYFDDAASDYERAMQLTFGDASDIEGDLQQARARQPRH
jgi:hypothetical protein